MMDSVELRTWADRKDPEHPTFQPGESDPRWRYWIKDRVRELEAEVNRLELDARITRGTTRGRIRQLEAELELLGRERDHAYRQLAEAQRRGW